MDTHHRVRKRDGWFGGGGLIKRRTGSRYDVRGLRNSVPKISVLI